VINRRGLVLVSCLLLILLANEEGVEIKPDLTDKQTNNSRTLSHRQNDKVSSYDNELTLAPYTKSFLTKQQAQPRHDRENAVPTITTDKADKVAVSSKIPLHNQNAKQLWLYWQYLLKQSELQQIPIIGSLLAERLRKNPEPSVYRGIADLINDPKIPVEHKALLLDLLAEIATPDSLTQLLNLAAQEVESPMYIFILQAIAHIGDNLWDGQFHEELSPILEAAWSNPENNDESLLYAIATAIAKVGAPNGINKLLKSVSGNNKDKINRDKNRTKQQIAFVTIPSKVRNPNAVESLNNCLSQESVGSPTHDVCGAAIESMSALSSAQSVGHVDRKQLKKVISTTTSLGIK